MWSVYETLQAGEANSSSTRGAGSGKAAGVTWRPTLPRIPGDCKQSKHNTQRKEEKNMAKKEDKEIYNQTIKHKQIRTPTKKNTTKILYKRQPNNTCVSRLLNKGK